MTKKWGQHRQRRNCGVQAGGELRGPTQAPTESRPPLSSVTRHFFNIWRRNPFVLINFGVCRENHMPCTLGSAVGLLSAGIGSIWVVAPQDPLGLKQLLAESLLRATSRGSSTEQWIARCRHAQTWSSRQQLAGQTCLRLPSTRSMTYSGTSVWSRK